MAKLACGHQPNYLPYLGFFHKMLKADVFVIVDTVQFVKRGTFGWMHRNKIRTHDGWQWLSLPVKTSGKRFQLCSEAELQNDLPWAHKHWRSIEVNYGKSPGFGVFADGFHALYQQEWLFVADLATALIRLMAKYLEIDTPIVRASGAGIDGEAQELIASICRYAGTNRYLSGVHGHDYLDPEDMRRRGVELEFQEFVHPVYTQRHAGEFIPNLSSIDFLFNLGANAPALLRECT